MSGGLAPEFGLDGEGLAWLEPLRRVHGDRLLGELGPYDLLEQASRGGQGIVFRARHRTTGRVVALKRLRAGALADVAARRRLEREVLATSGLDHPAIVRYDALEEVRGEPILVLEWIDGVPVNEWAWPLDGRAPPLERRVEVFVEICEAVRHAHRRGVLHRDLKPSNVLVDASGRSRLLDFGLAKSLHPAPDATSLTQAREFVGTLAYASPEQLEGSTAVDVRSDVFSLGVLGYEMVSGSRPFHAEGGAAAWREAVLGAPPPPLQGRVRGVDRGLDAILREALRGDAERRTPTVDALVSDLRRWLAGEPPSVVRPGVLGALLDVARRHRGPFALAGALVVALAAGTALVALHAHRVRAERDRAITAEARASALLDFLLDDLLLAADFVTNGRVVDLDEALRRATERVHERTDVEAPVRLRMMDVIAGVHERLNRPGAAALVLDRALALLRAEPAAAADPRDEAARLSSRLGECRARLGEWALAEEALAAAEEVQDAAGPSADRARTLLRRALLAGLRDENDRSDALHRDGLAMLTSALGPDHGEVLRWRTSFAAFLMRQGRLGEAEPALDDVLSRRRRALGDEHPEVAYVLSLLGRLRLHRGHVEEGAGTLQEALRIQERLVDPPDAVTAAMLRDLAEARALQGTYEAARDLYDRAIAVLRRPENRDVPTLALTLLARGETQIMTMELEAAERGIREAVALVRERFGDRSTMVADALVSLAQVLWNRGALEEADAAAVEGWELSVALRGEQTPASIDVLQTLAMIRAARGLDAEAVTSFERAVALQSGLGLRDHPYTANLLANLSDHHFASGRLEEAEARMREAIAIAERHEDALRLALMKVRLGRVLARTGRAADAEPMIAANVESLRTFLPEAHGWIALALECRCAALLALGRDADAEAAVFESVRLVREQAGPGHPALAERAGLLERVEASRP